ncbi:uridine diphosphate-N-acetylglucosamine-binding protein YvcK [Colwellia piezophila]|uniref:uridine diphosphate-N-acetylglucosamine-binding protein YvcK n=1 Tax=Colwellia piezophila TaxID=211668 RepID=UPI00037D5F2E|nr:uridine diphosphate-N-acetylglucosamine-binding protein YvcK [Colwellia piezophila]
MTAINVTCIGGGHGLGHLLAVINDFDFVNLTGIVTTTDNGGSTGRLRKSCDTISWGDIRYCLSKLTKASSTKGSSTKALLFEYRFDNVGELSGHSLGNLMFCAVDSLCLRPTETVQVMREYLGIKANVLPMSDMVTHLVSHCADHCYVGEVEVDDHVNQGINKLALTPRVKPSEEVLQNLTNSDILFLGPGSFYTSTLPGLLMDAVIDVINHNTKLKVYFITNVQSEFNNQHDELHYQLGFMRKLGLTKTIHSLIPRHRASPFLDLCKPYTIAELPADTGGRHQQSFYREQLLELIKPH